MDDLISRQAALSLAKDIVVPTKEGYVYRHTCIDPCDIMELPSAEPTYTDEQIQKMQDLEQVQIQTAYEIGKAERKTGRWVEQEEYWECSECKDQFVLEVGVTPKDARMFYCPNCGAKMEVEYDG